MGQETNKQPLEEREMLTYDKMYFPDMSKYTKTMGKTTLLVLVGVLLINLMFSDVEWWAKTLFGAGAFLLGALTYYDVKYMMGVKKNPFMVFPEEKKMRYYNEFEGNKEIDIAKIKEIKVYSRVRPKETFLCEIFIEGQKNVENVNVSGFTEDVFQELLTDLRLFNSTFALTSGRDKKK